MEPILPHFSYVWFFDVLIFFVGIGLLTCVNKTNSASFCRNSRLKSSFISSNVNLTFEINLFDEYVKILRTTLSRFIYFQQIGIKTGHG